MLKNNVKSYLQLHFIVFIWGFTAILGALISINAIPLVWYRMSLAVIFIFLYFLITKKSFRIKPKDILKFFISGTIIAIHWIAFFKAIKISNVSITLITLSTGALFTSFLEPLFFKRRIIISEIIFGLIVISGLYLIFNFETGHELGILYALLAAFLSALFAVLNGIFIKKHSGETISFYQLFFGVVFVSIYILLNSNITLEEFEITKTDFIYLFILSSFCTAYAFIVSVNIMKYISPFTVMLTINLEPVYGIILALLIFGEKEKMSSAFYIGALIILATVITNGILKSKKTKKNT